MSDELNLTPTSRVAAQSERDERANIALILGALFDFCGFLTTRDERLTVSGYDDAGPMVKALETFMQVRAIDDKSIDPRIMDWREAIADSRYSAL